MRIHDIPPGSIVVGVDGSEHSQQALDWAADAAARQHRLLALVHSRDPLVLGYGSSLGADSVDWAVVERETTAAVVAALSADAEHARARHPELRVIEVNDLLDARIGLVAASREAHLLVLGSRGRGPVASFFLGSVSAAVSRDAFCPVVVIRPGSEESAAQLDAPVVAAIDETPTSAAVLELAFELADELDAPLRVVHCVWSVVLGDEDVYTRGRLSVAQALAGLGEKHPDVSVAVDILEGPRTEVLVAITQGVAVAVVGHDRASGVHRLVWGSIAAAILERASCAVAVVPGVGGTELRNAVVSSSGPTTPGRSTPPWCRGRVPRTGRALRPASPHARACCGRRSRPDRRAVHGRRR